MSAPLLAAIDSAELFRYPIPVGVRLESHGWFQFKHAWWRSSDFRRDADPDVRAVWFDLLCGAQDEDPVGTLPVAPKDLAWIARVSLDEWMRYMGRSITPLYGWERCLCSDNSVRLYHSKLLLVTKDAARSHLDTEQRRADDRERKRMKDLPEKIRRAGGHRGLFEDEGYKARLDQYLVDHVDPMGSRTVARVRAAMEALALADLAM